MKILSATAVIFIFTTTSFLSLSYTKPDAIRSRIITEPKIQVAILLDVSGSMGGLIEQAKTQLWNMVTVIGKARCETGNPKIEIALYEYGRATNDAKAGFIKQLSPFTSDLDQLSTDLFKLTINGSEEYCGQVIYTSLDELNWDSSPSSYKVIFIAGNEDFLQGTVHYTKACAEANKKGVIVNTIYCGDRLQGIKEHWDLAGECGSGSYSNIDQDVKMEDIFTPYDSTLVVLNNKLNSTYIFYGDQGYLSYSKQRSVDQLNSSMSRKANLKRVEAKAVPNAYNNQSWDMVDAYKADTLAFLESVRANTLPDSLKNKNKEELQKVVTAKAKERSVIQAEIQRVARERQQYINTERAKASPNNNATTLETEVEKIIKSQAKRFKMTIE